VELVWDAVAIVRTAQHDDGHLAGSSAERQWDDGVAQADTYLIPPHGEGEGRVLSGALSFDLIKE
jgi:hypothetical protein